MVRMKECGWELAIVYECTQCIQVDSEIRMKDLDSLFVLLQYCWKTRLVSCLELILGEGNLIPWFSLPGDGHSYPTKYQILPIF